MHATLVVLVAKPASCPCTDLQPFMGGTYFPPQDAFGRPGFATVLQRISEVWRSKQAMVEEQTADVMRQLEQHTKPQRARTMPIAAPIWLDTAALCARCVFTHPFAT
jgi:uncharacterized protein YyaL (SSP411 family)